MADAVLIDDVLDYLNMDTPTPADQAELAQYISAAVQTVEMYCGPIIAREVTDHDLCGARSVVLDHRPVVELVSIVEEDGTSLDVDGFRVVRDAGLVRPVAGQRFPCGFFDVTYRAGWAATVADVPDALALACQVIVAHLYGDQRAPTLGPQVGLDAEFTTTAWTSRGTGTGYAIPYKARDLMAPFWRVSPP